MIDATKITSTFDIYSHISNWFSGNWSTAIKTINKALQLPASKSSLKVTGTIGEKSSSKINITYGQIHFLKVDLVISSLVIDLTNKKLTLKAAPVVTSGHSNWNLTNSLPDISSFELLEGLIKKPEFTFKLSVNDGKPDCTLSFKCNISTSGTGLSSEASKFIGFFGNTGMAQLFLHHFNGGIIPGGIKLSGTIDFTSPVKTKRCGNVPNIQLTASLSGTDDSFTLFNFLKVKNPRLSFKTVSSETTKTQHTPLFASIEPSFEMDLIVGQGSDAVDIAFSCGAPPELGSITLVASNAGSNQINLEDVFSLMNGNSWEGMIPGPLQTALNDIDLQSISANISLPQSYSSESKFGLNWITVNVSSDPNKKIQLFDPFKEFTFKVIWNIFNPLERDKMYSLINFYADTECTISSNKIDFQLSVSEQR